MDTIDAIIVPTGGIIQDKDGISLPPWVIRRLDRAADLFSSHTKPLILTGGGTVHKSQPSELRGERGSHPLYESDVCARYLMDRWKIPQDSICCERISLDTVGSMWYTRTTLTDPTEFGKLLLMTSDFTLLRTRYIAEWIFNLQPGDYHLSFESVSDSGLEDLLSERIQKERQALDWLKNSGFTARITTMKSFFDYLTKEHKAYIAGAREYNVDYQKDVDVKGSHKTY